MFTSYVLLDLNADGSNGDSHGEFDTLDEAVGAVIFDRLDRYSIWKRTIKDGEFIDEVCVRHQNAGNLE